MRKEVRRFVMFCTILTVGLLLLFIEVTFIQLLLLMVFLAVVLPFLLGMVTIAELRTAINTFKEERLKKIGLFKKLDEIKLFERKGIKKQESAPPKKVEKPGAAPGKTAVSAPRKIPFGAQIGSLVATFKSFGTSIKARTRPDRKVTDINKMLDSAVSGKVEKITVPAAPPAGDTTLPAPGGAGSTSSAEEDPFLSLSGDEFDAGLLEGLDEGDMAMPGMPEAGLSESSPEMDAAAMDILKANAADGDELDMTLPEPDLSESSPEMDAAAMDILKANAADEGGLDEFSGLEAGGESDAEFGDLDNISLDDVDLDADLEEDMEGAGGAAPEPAAAEPAAAAPPAAPSAPEPVKTTWIPSDAPGGADLMDDQIGIQSDMAAFASSSGGTDEDLLSSIASDVKHVAKEKDLSLLRELKDFKAPADQIEKELTDMYQRLSAAQKLKDKKTEDKKDSITNEIK